MMAKKPLSLESLERLGWRFGLETTQILLAELGNPHLGLRVIHVAGTNGKGSTCAYLASILRCSGFKTGLYTSPHLCDIRERFRVDGEWISPRDFKRHSRRVLEACKAVRKKLGHFPTQFEALTAIGFSWFQEQQVEWLVLEVGLGGRLDATNVIKTPEISLITPIGLEHQEILGNTLGEIATEKAGILKPGGRAVTLQYQPEALRAIRQRAKAQGTELWESDKDFTYKWSKGRLTWEGLGLKGSFKLADLPEYQAANVALAIAGIQLLSPCGVNIAPKKIQQGLSEMSWPGRLEKIRSSPLTLVDGAHNPDAARALTFSLKRKYPGQKMIILNGFLKDKDFSACAKILAPHAALAVVTHPRSDRFVGGGEVVKAWEKAGIRAFWVGDWRQALEFSRSLVQGSKSPLLVMGSLYLVGACRKEMVGNRGLAKI